MIRLCSVVRDDPQLFAENELVGAPFVMVTQTGQPAHWEYVEDSLWFHVPEFYGHPITIFQARFTYEIRRGNSRSKILTILKQFQRPYDPHLLHKEGYFSFPS